MNDVYIFNKGIVDKKTSPRYCFIASNGFPPESFRQLVSEMGDLPMVSPLLRPLSSKKDRFISSWLELADDMHDVLKQVKPTHIIGHSIGGTLSLLLAIRHGYRFEHIVLLDPALFSSRIYWAYRFIKCMGLHKRLHPLIQVTLKRKRVFNSRNDIIETYRKKLIFSQVQQSILEAYIDSVFEEKDGVFHLTYSPEWEALIYETGICDDPLIWKGLHHIQSPITVIRGETSTVCTPAVVRKFSQYPQISTITVPKATHLLPLEYPKEVSRILRQVSFC